jgi:hypothetical protein
LTPQCKLYVCGGAAKLRLHKLFKINQSLSMYPKYLLLLLITAQLGAQSALYEAFDTGEATRADWLTEWHRMQGVVSVVPQGLALEGLPDRGGALQLSKKGEALAQHGASIAGTYYGAFRVQASDLTDNTVLGLMLSRAAKVDGLNPKTAAISFLVKGWQTNYGVLLIGGRPIKATAGEPIVPGETYLVVYQVDHSSSGKAQLWILNEAQAGYHAAQGITAAALNAAALSAEAGGVMQRVSGKIQKKNRVAVIKGDVVACVAKYCPQATFDEIRISSVSLQDAVVAAQ